MTAVKIELRSFGLFDGLDMGRVNRSERYLDRLLKWPR